MRTPMKATVVHFPNAVDRTVRTVKELRTPRRIKTLAPKWDDAPFIALLNGEPVMRADWDRTVKDGDVLAFTRLPRGGGDNGGSQTLAIVAMIALTIAAPYAAGAVLGTTAAAAAAAGGTAALTFNVTTTLITMAGSALINSMLPAPQGPSTSQPSPTYSLNAVSNTARLESVIPVGYGEMQFYPDLAAQPYSTYSGGDQYLHQLFCIGQGEYSIDPADILIEDSPISAFSEVEYEIVPPGQPLDLFPHAVDVSDEVSGQQFEDRDMLSWSRSGNTVTLTVEGSGHKSATGDAVYLYFLSGTNAPPNGVYEIATISSDTVFTVTTSTSASGSGDGRMHKMIGGKDGFVTNAAGTKARRLGIDLACPKGLFDDVSGDIKTTTLQVRIQVREIDDSGDFVSGSSWTTIGDETLKGRTRTPVRKSFTYTLANPGRYRIRAYRVDDMLNDPANGHDLVWLGLRAYIKSDRVFPGVTLLAVKMRATNNLSARASNRVKVTATRKLPIWNGSSWSAPTATRSIAWAIADIARNATYGAGLPDSRLDLAALLELDAVWTSRGDRFDARFDTKSTCWAALSSVAFAGRAKVFMQGGKLRVVRDGPSNPVALFSSRNMIAGSFSMDYAMDHEATADSIEVSYLDRANWQQNRVTCSLNGTKTKPVKLELFGVVSRAQAMREGFYHAAVNRLRRRMVRFETELEGYIPLPGDTVALQADAPGWGLHAETIGWDSGAGILTLSERMVLSSSKRWYIGLRTDTGGMVGPYEVASLAGEENKLIVLEPMGITPHTSGVTRERTHVVIGEANSYRTLAKVTKITPLSTHRLRLEAVVDDVQCYLADDGKIAPPTNTSLLPKVPREPVVRGLSARINGSRVAFAWDPAPGETGGYELEFAHGTDPSEAGLDWSGATAMFTTTWTGALPYGAKTLIRVRALGLLPGPWVVTQVSDLLGTFWRARGTLGKFYADDGAEVFWV